MWIKKSLRYIFVFFITHIFMYIIHFLVICQLYFVNLNIFFENIVLIFVCKYNSKFIKIVLSSTEKLVVVKNSIKQIWVFSHYPWDPLVTLWLDVNGTTSTTYSSKHFDRSTNNRWTYINKEIIQLNIFTPFRSRYK